MGQVDRERGGDRRIGRAVVGLCLGCNSCDGDPFLSVMVHDYSAWLLICISFGMLWLHHTVCLSAAPDPSDKHCQTHLT